MGPETTDEDMKTSDEEVTITVQDFMFKEPDSLSPGGP